MGYGSHDYVDVDDVLRKNDEAAKSSYESQDFIVVPNTQPPTPDDLSDVCMH